MKLVMIKRALKKLFRIRNQIFKLVKIKIKIDIMDI